MKISTIRFWLKPKTPFIDQCPQLGYKVEERHGRPYIDIKGNPFDATAQELTFIPKDAVECVTFRGVISLPWWLEDGLFLYKDVFSGEGQVYVRRIAAGGNRNWFRSPRYVAVWATISTQNGVSSLKNLRDAYTQYRVFLKDTNIIREADRAWTCSTEDFFSTLPMPNNPTACDGTPIHDTVSAPRR